MAGDRGGSRAKITPTKGRTRNIRHSSEETDVFRELLEEAEVSSQASAFDEGRMVKRRRVARVAGRLVVSENQPALQEEIRDDTTDETQDFRVAEISNKERPTSPAQTICRDSESESDSDESDEDEWENVNLSGSDQDESSGPRKEAGDLNLVFEHSRSSKGTRASRGRRGQTKAAQLLREQVHKAHIVASVTALHKRNRWCNDSKVQAALRIFLEQRTIKLLQDDPKRSQFNKSSDLILGLKQAVDYFKPRFTISSRGLARNFWDPDGETDFKVLQSKLPEGIEAPFKLKKFREIAKSDQLQGSRDTGVLLFCAMLRSLGLDVRLVCSLQILPLSNTSKTTTPQNSQLPVVVSHVETRQGMDDGEDASEDEESAPGRRQASPDPKDYSSAAAVPRQQVKRFFGRANNTYKPPPKPKEVAPPPPKPKKPRIKESSYPVFWVEVYNKAKRKWVPVDPLVTKTIGDYTKFEPPAADQENQMAYVIAFEQDYSAKDVTRRYAKAIAAKTRRLRADNSKTGEVWFQKVMKLFINEENPRQRDEDEEVELGNRAAAEPMPRSLADFKDHPTYALERHLRRTEVLHPKRKSGQTSAGVGKPMEDVFRRRDVHVVRSQTGWYRIGRTVKENELEKPLKFLPPRRRLRKRRKSSFDADANDLTIEDHDGKVGDPMYAYFQTEQYDPGVVDEGWVPRNIYGKIDVFVPSMIPAGAVFIDHPQAEAAAWLIKGFNYLVPTTGFNFVGGVGKPIRKGIVTAVEHGEAVIEVIRGYRYFFEQEDAEERSWRALSAWRRCLRRLQIQRRIRLEAGLGTGVMSRSLGEASASDDGEPEDAKSSEDPRLILARTPIRVTWGRPLPYDQRPAVLAAKALQAREDPGGFLFEDDEEVTANYAPSGFLPDADTEDQMEYSGGAGFLPGSGEEIGGGFVLEEEESVQDGFSIDPEQSPINNAGDANPARLELSSNIRHERFETDAPTDLQAEGTSVMAPQSDVAEVQGLARDEKDSIICADPATDLLITDPPKPRDKTAGEASTHTAPSSQGDQVGQAVEETRQADEDDWDKGSLLSEDPEDEDAIPDWLS